MKDIVTERREADTPQGCEFARRLETMPPDHAADELLDMYSRGRNYLRTGRQI